MGEIVHNIAVGPVQAAARTKSNEELVPYVEFTGFLDKHASSLDLLLQSPHPWHMRTHLNASFYEHFFQQRNCPKFILVIRNPKDILVSYYHFHLKLPFDMVDFTFNKFFEVYKNKALLYGDPLDHHLSWWKFKDHPNLHIVHYEDILSDPVKEISKLAKHLGHSYSDDELKAIAANISFGKMKTRSPSEFWATNDKMLPTDVLFRKGIKGDWKDHFDGEQDAYIESVIKENTTPEGLVYKF